ncbi:MULTISPECIES: FG-GAP-like repeat-containing protein [unclassified Kitasatospora]|uniref:FG-GAP-like repeat-containing protein n=1 Tax=unclassified Kitasatospora TaxID=2633591 RepID=UPI001ADF7420|nr:FG-GAP-like repeat-containing protein [Kitasatospora sp. RG8]MBP0452709.1 transglycosylase family protein [Kitasatospora sp. RG8]
MSAQTRLRRSLTVLALSVAPLCLAGTAGAASVSTWDKVAACESSGNWSINTGNGYYGGLQISEYNWRHYGGTQYAAYPHQATKKEQILVAEKILADQGAGAWTCSPGTGLSTDHADPYPAGPADPGMTNLTAGDFNGDGKKDLVAVEVSTGKLFSYPGTGTGALGGRVMIGNGGWNGMGNLAVGDLNGDGGDDIVATEKSTGKLWVYPGNGHGVEGRIEIGSGGWNGMNNTAVGDFTGDGVADVVASENSTGKLFLYPGLGGALGKRVEIGSGGWNGMNKIVSPGDMNKDGRDDIVATEKSTGKLWLYPGTGNGLGSRVEIGTGGWNGISDYAGADFTGDGIGDLAAVDSDPGQTGKLYLYKGTGNGLSSRTEIGSGGW